MARNNPRKWPCVDCRTPKTATRPGTRCPACQVVHARQRDAARYARQRTEHDRYLARQAKLRQLTAKRQAAARAARQAARVPDAAAVDAIALYRAEKAKRAARTDALIAHARSLLADQRAA